MSKEFNIDDYQYVEEHMPLHQWHQHQPKLNNFIKNARFNGLLLEHEGDQWVEVMKTPVHYIWTVFEDDDGNIFMRNGYQVRGRIGYVISEQMHNAHATIFVDGITRDLLETRILEDH